MHTENMYMHECLFIYTFLICGVQASLDDYNKTHMQYSGCQVKPEWRITSQVTFLYPVAPFITNSILYY